jgi:L-threonylcarbamoyladenylate synthase
MIKEYFIIQRIKAGEIVAIPTDTIFGLSCLPTMANIDKLNKLKQRNPNKGFILLTSNLQYLTPFIEKKYITILKKEYATITTPTTFIVPSNHAIATHHSLAIRLTDNAFINTICTKTHSAIVSTSCNISGKKSITSLLMLRKFFGKINAIVPQVTNNMPSTIIDLHSKKIIRS